MRIAVVGAGAVGGYFGGRLAEAGLDVVFVARGAQLEALRRDGLRVLSVAGDFELPRVEATDDPAQAGAADAVLLCVKAWQVPEAARALLPLLRQDGFVVPLENGVEAAEQVADAAGAARVVPGLCKILSYVTAPGVIRHAGVAPRIEFAESDGRASARVSALRAAFERAKGVSVAVPEDIQAAVWEKFLFIAPVSGVGALTRVPIGVLRSVPETRALLLAAMWEVQDLGRARGVALRDGLVERLLGFVDSLPADGTASMQRDILEGRRSELESQNGAVVRLARPLGLPVPVNETIYRALLPAELRARGALPA